MTSRPFHAVLFDLGNTLVSYYRAEQFAPILERSIVACARVLRAQGHEPDVGEAYERALSLDREAADGRVRPLGARLREAFADSPFSAETLGEMTRAFLEPIFTTARPDADALPVLRQLQDRGLKTAIVSNTPWGSPSGPWRDELARHGLLELVDAAVFCVDVGFRKPARPIFDRALSLLAVPAEQALFVGDDPVWDIDGARGAGLTPVLVSQTPSDLACWTIGSLSELPNILP